MRTFFNDSNGTGNAATFAHTAVNNAARAGVPTKVLSQYLDKGTYGPADVNNPDNPTGTGIAVTSVNLAGGPYYEASIEYDFRFVGSGQWPYGGKLPGIGGSTTSSPPTGGQPKTTGFSCRLMHRRTSKTDPTAPGKLVSYVYDPTLAAQGQGTTGTDHDLGIALRWTQWYHVKQYVRMNSVIDDGKTYRADGVHRVEVDGVQVYESVTQVWRFYLQAKVGFYVHDLFLGGNTPEWAAPSNIRVDIDNLLITTP